MGSLIEEFEVRRIYEKDLHTSDPERVRLLLGQLRGVEQPPISFAQLKLCVRHSIFIVAFNKESTIVGMARVVMYHGFYSRVGEVGDVVVDEEYRGKRLGERIMREVVHLATQEELLFLSLTSNEARAAAHKLYEKLGFQNRGETTRFYLPICAP